MRFEAKKELFYIIIRLHCGLMSAGLCGFSPWYTGEDLSVIITLQVLITAPLLLLPIYFYKCNYQKLSNEILFCKLGFITKTIPLESIICIYRNTKLDVVKTNLNNPLNTTINPSLATEGIVVKYGKYDYTFISPLNQEGFIIKLLELKPSIEQQEWILGSQLNKYQWNTF